MEAPTMTSQTHFRYETTTGLAMCGKKIGFDDNITALPKFVTCEKCEKAAFKKLMHSVVEVINLETKIDTLNDQLKDLLNKQTVLSMVLVKE